MGQLKINERPLIPIKEDNNMIRETKDKMLFTLLIEGYWMEAKIERT